MEHRRQSLNRNFTLQDSRPVVKPPPSGTVIQWARRSRRACRCPAWAPPAAGIGCWESRRRSHRRTWNDGRNACVSSPFLPQLWLVSLPSLSLSLIFMLFCFVFHLLLYKTFSLYVLFHLFWSSTSSSGLSNILPLMWKFHPLIIIIGLLFRNPVTIQTLSAEGGPQQVT